MKDPEDCKSIEEIRNEIDTVDNQIVKLIAKRAKYVDNAAKFKADIVSVKDDKRVARVIDSRRMLAEEHGISPELIEDIYRVMIKFFVGEEQKKWKAEK
ncbi:MAG: chorismate mutase [Bacteroidales bacterium]|nr:chorismate mutase [Bacteroidales bacterium]HPB05038.1 chorismate mutase [Prolixibacteraceae bacterium]